MFCGNSIFRPADRQAAAAFYAKSDLLVAHYALYHTIKSYVVSKRLGHASSSTTLNIYAHALQSKDKIAADSLEHVLSLDKIPC